MIGAVESRRELLVHAVSIVDPDLDQIDFPGGLLLDGLPAFRLGRDPVRRFGPPRLRHRDPASRGAEPRGAGNDFVPDLERHIARILAEAHHDAGSVVRLPLQRSMSASRVTGMCVCVSTIAGMTVLPVRSTRAAPAGTSPVHVVRPA